MNPLPPLDTLAVFMLLRQDGLVFTASGVSGTTPNLGVGMFHNRHDAEVARTLALLTTASSSASQYHVFELTIPNPAANRD